MINIGLNGFGRIGRALVRANLEKPRCSFTVINDIDPNVENHAYLLRHDSLYGRLEVDMQAQQASSRLIINGQETAFLHCRSLEDVSWSAEGASVVVDATGVEDHVDMARKLIDEGGLSHILLSYVPRQPTDFTMIYGVNDQEFDPNAHRLISTATCDANAVGPILRIVDEAFGIVEAHITTLHPWLAYQNLLDGSVRSVSSPSHFWEDFGLGRASTLSLIPKETTLVRVLQRAMPSVAENTFAISFRVPTPIVSAADMTITLRSPCTQRNVTDALRAAARALPHLINLIDEPLVSIDVLGLPQSAVIQESWIRLQSPVSLKLVAWYDNEWAYAERILDTLSRLDSGDLP